MPLFVQILFGAALLLLGRKLFWLFVAAVGYIVTLNLGAQFFADADPNLRLAVALVTGVVGAALAVILQRAAVWLAGFLGGGYVVLTAFQLLGQHPTGVVFAVVFLMGGIAGAFFVEWLFDWAVIALSSLMGALLIAPSLHLPRLINWLVIGAMFLVGLAVQARLTERERSTPRVPDKF